MSSRVLRKLQGDQDLKTAEDTSETESDLASSGVRKKQFNVNRYDLLNQHSHSESEVKEDDDNETETAEARNGLTEEHTSSRKKKKKRKKKSGKYTTVNNHRSSDDNIEASPVNELLEEFLGFPTGCCKYVVFHRQSPSISSTSLGRCQRNFMYLRLHLVVNPRTLPTSFVVNPNDEEATQPVTVCDKPDAKSHSNFHLDIKRRNLNPNNELKRIFGSKIFQNEQSRRRGHGRPYIKLPWLIKPNENWPPISKIGMSMRVVSAPYFTYEHNSSYRAIQKKFLEAVETMNPDNIIALINNHPYHVDSLIQLSDLCKLSEDLRMAAELIERALYCLESAFHPMFNLVTGNCCLDYNRQENRALFIALFKHLTFVGQRACYRTALELCKVLLSLNFQSDPLAVILCIDFYALRSKKYTWLVTVANEWEDGRNVSLLPNFAYSHALALFHLQNESADLKLQEALIMFPGVLMLLLDKCSVQPDSKVSGHAFFTSQVTANQSTPLSQLVQLYVARTYHEWKDSSVIAWLENNVHKVLIRVDEGDSYIVECNEKRKYRYMRTPRNVLRHIVLSDLKDVTTTLPPDAQGPFMSFDPFPPLDSIDIYTRPRALRNTRENSSPFPLFLRSLWPSFNINQPSAPALEAADLQLVAEGEEAAGNDTRTDLRFSVTTLLDAMRDLLSNIQLPEIDMPALHSDDEDDDDEEEVEEEDGEGAN